MNLKNFQHAKVFGFIIFFISLNFFTCTRIFEPLEITVIQKNKYQIIHLSEEKDPYGFETIASLSTNYPKDENGVRLFSIQGKLCYYPVNLSQFILWYIDCYNKTQNTEYLSRSELFANKIIDLSVSYNDACYLPYDFDINPHGNKSILLKAPWFSGMAQGQALSVFVRLYNITRNKKYLDFAHKLFYSFKNYKKDNLIWTVFIDADNYYWIEEYPDIEPGRVLNGFIFGIYGLYDYYFLTKDPVCKYYLEAAITTIQKYIGEFRNPGNVSFYCLRHEHTDANYHQIHIDQLKTLYYMTGESYFLNVADEFYNDYH